MSLIKTAQEFLITLGTRFAAWKINHTKGTQFHLTVIPFNERPKIDQLVWGMARYLHDIEDGLVEKDMKTLNENLTMLQEMFDNFEETVTLLQPNDDTTRKDFAQSLAGRLDQYLRFMNKNTVGNTVDQLDMVLDRKLQAISAAL